MKMEQIKEILGQLPEVSPTLKACKSGSISLIINLPEDNNIGFDVKYSFNGLQVTKFKREPYKTYDLSTGYEKLTAKQRDYVHQYLIKTYLPEYDYLIN